MASNPMQRKARISFLLGFLTMTIIGGAVIALLFMMMVKEKNEYKNLQGEMKRVQVLDKDIKAGQIITEEDCREETVSAKGIPGDAIGSEQGGEWFELKSLQDTEGNLIDVETQEKKNEKGEVEKDAQGRVKYEQKLFITIPKANAEKEEDVDRYELKRSEAEEKMGDAATSFTYYYETGKNNEKKFITLNTAPLIAKIDLKQNTILTNEMVRKGDNSAAKDVRVQEYNSIILPTELETGDYVDIRLALPNGQDYIVVSKKSVTIPDAGGTPIADTIRMSLSEMETLYMGNALIDSYLIAGSKLYATIYSEAGLQTAATPTYSPNTQVIALLARNPNILDQIKINRNLADDATQVSQLNSELGDLRQLINSEIENSESAAEGVASKVQESITSSQEARQAYLEGISGAE